MSGEPKDQAIKLFGKTILLPEIAGSCSDGRIGETSSLHEERINRDSEERENDQETLESLRSTHHQQQEDGPRPSSSMEDSTNPEESMASAEKTPTSKTEDEHSETSQSSRDQKPLKKPDKILPCPRCKSKDTKFCYYNNYNANQPRHFCRNCQRYWTAGGTMRNVPVGAGRRKTKTSASLHRPETLVRNGVSNPNGTVQVRGGHEGYNRNYAKSPSYLAFPLPPQAWPSGDLGFDTLQFYHGPPPICAPGFTVPLYLACGGAGAWPYVPTVSPPSQTGSSSGLNPQTLGKHPRNDEETLKSSLLRDDEKCIWVPKMRRIDDDPGEAAKSSIWASLGFRKESGDSASRNCVAEASSHGFLRANPAALSRSVNFNESS